MPTSIFKLVPSELKDLVNPTDDQALFRFGNGVNLMSEAKVLTLMQREENNTLSACPEHYREVASGNISGEILTNRELGARGGETSLNLGFFPVVEGSLVLYKNWESNNLPWASRTREYGLLAEEFDVDEATGEILLSTPLESGDRLYAEYQHDGATQIETLRDLVLKAARLELYSRFPNWTDATEVIREMREAIEARFIEFNQGERPRGVAEIDRVNFLQETRRDMRQVLKRPYMRGAL